MSLAADSIIDRIKLKEQIGRWRALAVLSLILLAILFVGKSTDGLDLVQKDRVARITIEGLIRSDAYRDRVLQGLAKNKRIKAVILHVNSPGGTMVGSELLYKRIRKVAQAKPVVVVMGSVAASGGYMVATAAERIFAQEGTVTGSIGVLFQSAEITELSNKIGVTFNTFKSAPLKASPSPFEKLTPNVSDAINVLVQDNYELFLDIVAEGRGVDKESIRNLADGRVYTGRQSVSNTLIDAIGGEDEALKWLQDNKNIGEALPVVDIKLRKEPSPFERALNSLIGDETFSALRDVSLQGVLVLWQPGVL